MGEARFAAIDLGTVSSRLLCATVRDGVVVNSAKRTVITDLGEGVDASGVFAPGAIERVARVCGEFVNEARAYGATCVSTTLTSAARDVSNGEKLLGRLRDLGLAPQVISGNVEALLTFYGVAHDFPGERIAVADSGGGSTELVVGAYAPGEGARAFALDCAQSLNIGCRRVTERFFTQEPPAQDEVEAAVAWMAPQFEAYWSELPARPDRLIAVGAMVHELAVYDSHFVHLRDLTAEQVDDAIEMMRGLCVEQVAALPGIQPKRAPVIFAGAVIVRELMRAGGYKRLTVSENSLLAGAAATICETMAGGEPVIGWAPTLSAL